MQAKRSPAARLGQFLRECLCWDKAFTRNVFLVALPMVLQSLVESSLHIVDGLMVSALCWHWPLEAVYLCTIVEEVVKMAIGIPRLKSRKWMHVLTEAKENA